MEMLLLDAVVFPKRKRVVVEAGLQPFQSTYNIMLMSQHFHMPFFF